MTTTPNAPIPDDDQADSGSPTDVGHSPVGGDAPGAEIGVSEGEGSTFEPEEDAEGHG